MASWLTDALDYISENKDTIGPLVGIAGTAGLFGDIFSPTNTGPKGYQGSIPYYTANRARVPNTYDPTRRPGSGGQRYFSDTIYTPTASTMEGARTTPLTPEQIENIAAAQQAGQAQAEGLAALNLSNPANRYKPVKPVPPPTVLPTPISMETTPLSNPPAFAAKPLTGPKMGTVSSAPPVMSGAISQQSEETPRTQGIDSLARLAGYQNGGEVSINLGDLDTTAAGAKQMGTSEDYIKYQNAIQKKQDAYFNKPEEERSIKELQEILAMKSMLRSGFYGAMGNRFGDEDKFYKGMEELTNKQAKYFRNMANGGLAGLAKGRYLRSSSDGMADKIPATIDKTQPAALSGGEYVIPADVVSHLGNGNSDAGAKVLDKMMERIRKTRTGNGKQGKEIDPNKLLPA